jgi:mono/diheme cytochrome c family protein
MGRPSAKHLLALAATAALAAGCGQEITLDQADRGNEQIETGAQLFYDRCSGCHTLDAAASEGSAFQIGDRERVDGPNFNVRPVDRESVLYAIRNGGFSGAIMPENIVVGEEAEAIAEYLARYAGRDAEKPVTPNAPQSP